MGHFTDTEFSERYKEYLRSEHWKGLRAERMRICKGRCEACGGKRGCLHGHHIRYKNLFDCEARYDLIMLCETCHKDVHQMFKGLSYRPQTTKQTLDLLRDFWKQHGLDHVPLHGPDNPPKRKLTNHERRIKRQQERERNEAHWPVKINGKFVHATSDGLVPVTAALFAAGRSRTGGWNRAQLAAIGITWPLQAKWQKRALKTKVTEAQADLFLSLKDASKSQRRIPQERDRSEDPF